jgi:hypothetical protein
MVGFLRKVPDELLDMELLDSNERRCGRVDGIEYAGGPDQPGEPLAILCGPGAWKDRLPPRLARLSEKLFGKRVVRVPWSHVVEVKHTIRLDAPSNELGLAGGDRGLAERIVQRLPGSNL